MGAWSVLSAGLFRFSKVGRRKVARANFRFSVADSQKESPISRTALVTGAARGIGLATVRKLLDAGHRVAMADHDAEALAGPRQTLTRQASGSSPFPPTSPLRTPRLPSSVRSSEIGLRCRYL